MRRRKDANPEIIRAYGARKRPYAVTMNTSHPLRQGALRLGLSRGLRERCPNCGQGRLLRAYLKVVSPCPVCGHDNGRYPADDAPPYFTILIVGHILVAPMFMVPGMWAVPAWLLLSIGLPIAAALTLFLLPRVKGAVIGLHWAITRSEGQVPGQTENPRWSSGADPVNPWTGR
jgi:uncharacterized protein (DUF983 family)